MSGKVRECRVCDREIEDDIKWWVCRSCIDSQRVEMNRRALEALWHHKFGWEYPEGLRYDYRRDAVVLPDGRVVTRQQLEDPDFMLPPPEAKL